MNSNVNRVPKKHWRKWSAKARHVFNETYSFIHDYPDLMNHPAAPKPKPFHWKTVAWNAGWIAADAVDDSLPTEVVTLTRSGREVARKEIRT